MQHFNPWKTNYKSRFYPDREFVNIDNIQFRNTVIVQVVNGLSIIQLKNFSWFGNVKYSGWNQRVSDGSGGQNKISKLRFEKVVSKYFIKAGAVKFKFRKHLLINDLFGGFVNNRSSEFVMPKIHAQGMLISESSGNSHF